MKLCAFESRYDGPRRDIDRELDRGGFMTGPHFDRDRNYGSDRGWDHQERDRGWRRR